MKVNFLKFYLLRFLDCLLIFISFFFLYAAFDALDSFYVSREVFGGACMSIPVFAVILFKASYDLLFSFLKVGDDDES